MIDTTLPYCYIEGRKDLKIYIDKDCPEKFLQDKSLVELTGDELKKALNKPFVVTKDLSIVIEFEDEKYSFVIEKGYDWNGANVPPFCWLLIGQQKEPRFKLASCVHDYMCENKNVVGNNRYLSTLIFETLCEYFGRFNSFKRWAMFHSVDNYQKFCGWRTESDSAKPETRLTSAKQESHWGCKRTGAEAEGLALSKTVMPFNARSKQ